jgi:hypothetical protein
VLSSCKSLLLLSGITDLNSLQCSAANDFWGQTYLKMSGEAKMTQQLSIVTGCSAGATESFVVVPFELVKVKYGRLSFSRFFFFIVYSTRL